MKRCHQCQQEWPLDCFRRDVRYKGGRIHECRTCEAARNRRSRLANPGAHRARVARYAERYPERVAASHRRARIKRAAASAAYCRQYRLDHLTEIRERERLYTKAHPELMREKALRRYATKKGAAVGIVDYARIMERDGGNCHICGASIPPGEHQFDHIVPLSRGGAHSEANIALAHRLCNQRKHVLPLAVARERLA